LREPSAEKAAGRKAGTAPSGSTRPRNRLVKSGHRTCVGPLRPLGTREPLVAAKLELRGNRVARTGASVEGDPRELQRFARAWLRGVPRALARASRCYIPEEALEEREISVPPRSEVRRTTAFTKAAVAQR
jgi:hypothetical protein